ncbi:MAG: hypothetical protein AB8U25_04755 [Rickettsiales endosymbiont of Dermacentor nuttalli]
MEKALTLKNKLLLNSTTDVLLHGDNILTNGSEFVIIDPKGVIGNSINEVWAFVIDQITDTEFIANYFNLQEVREWYFV